MIRLKEGGGSRAPGRKARRARAAAVWAPIVNTSGTPPGHMAGARRRIGTTGAARPAVRPVSLKPCWSCCRRTPSLAGRRRL